MGQQWDRGPVTQHREVCSLLRGQQDPVKGKSQKQVFVEHFDRALDYLMQSLNTLNVY